MAAVLILMTSIQLCQGQILNVERFRLTADTSNALMGSAGVGFNTKKQQIAVTKINSDVHLAYLTQEHSIMLLSNLALVKVENENVISEGYAHLRLNFWRKDPLSFEQFNQIQYDLGRGMRQRSLTGGAARLRILDSDKASLAMSSGVMLEDEIWVSEPVDIQKLYLKSSSNINIHWKLHKNLTYLGIAYYQSRFSSFFEPRITVDTSLLLAVNDKFFFTNQFVLTYDAAPVVEIAELIYSFNSGISYQF